MDVASKFIEYGNWILSQDFPIADVAWRSEQPTQTSDASGIVIGAPITVTLFRDARARTSSTEQLTLADLQHRILRTTALDKLSLPWLKLAIFGQERTKAGSLRHDGNVLQITGIELDYDGGVMSFDEALGRLRAANLFALVYITPSHTEQVPRWRLVVPTSRSLPPDERAKLVARVNGLFGGIFARESFALSQAYFFGSVNNNSAHRAEISDGDFIDRRSDLDAGAIGPRNNNAAATTTPDTTRPVTLPPALEALLNVEGSGPYPSCSELLFAFITAGVRARVSEDAIVAACLDDAYSGCGIYEHCRENEGNHAEGRRAYVERQISRARERIGATEALTDLGNARRLVRRRGSDLRFVPEWKTWLSWEESHWQRDGDGAVVRAAKATVEDMFAEAAQVIDEEARKRVRKHAMESQSAARLSAMVELAKTEIEVVLSASALDADTLILGVQNGVVDLRTTEFRNARREDLVTKRAGAAFDRDATCPEWEAFLRKIMPDDELIRYVQRAVGYVLTGMTTEEVMFVLWGSGANGKSTFRETIFALLGDYAMGADASLLVTKKRDGATPDVARLHGRRLVTINETQQNDMLNEARVKFITGRDMITARNLYEEFFDFKPTHKTFLTTNHKPIVRGTDEGIWRRIHLLPFTITIPPEDRDVNFRERVLMPELSGILNWTLDGLRAYQSQGLDPPAVVTEATDEYRDDMDIVGRWIEERCERDPTSKVATATLHSDYEMWAASEIGFSMSAIAFGRELVERGFEKVYVERARGVRGLRLRCDFNAAIAAADRLARGGR